MDDKALIRAAIEARKNSHSPYSKFMVGAALLARNGRIYCGCNIENAAFTPTNCAERTAFFKAVSEGVRDFEAIAVAGWSKDGKPGFAYPCGVCRQVMAEFCHPANFRIVIAKSEDDYETYTLAALLPHGFGVDSIG